MVALARAHFAALDRCASPATVIVVGDARLGIAAETAPLDFLVLDVFSSEAIPVHMLTTEAFETYLEALAPGGAIAVHISNRHLSLAPVVGGAAARLGLAGRIRSHEPDGDTELHAMDLVCRRPPLSGIRSSRP